MNHRRYVSAAAVVASAAALLATACASSDASPRTAASTATVSTTAGPATHGQAGRGPVAISVADAHARTTGAAAGQPAVTSGVGGANWKPCHLPAGYKHFFELHSAKNSRGKTVVRVTPETCSVNTKNDEDVAYTPSGAARSLDFAPGASVQVLHDTDTVKVTPKWLVTHKLANTPHFVYRVNGRSQITAMREIYHP